jgi:hypothetical protein
MRCDECRYWKTKDEDGEQLLNDIDSIPLGICTSIPLYFDATEHVFGGEGKAQDDISRQLKAEHKNKLAFTQDGSDYRADLYTMARFFCAHFEAIAEKPAAPTGNPITHEATP